MVNRPLIFTGRTPLKIVSRVEAVIKNERNICKILLESEKLHQVHIETFYPMFKNGLKAVGQQDD